MLNVDITKLEKCVADLHALTKDALLATDIWDRSTGLSLAGHNAQPAAVALFNQLTGEISGTLEGAGFPALSRYYMLDLANDNSVVILQHGSDLIQGILLNSKKTNLGIIFGIAIPRLLEAVAQARG